MPLTDLTTVKGLYAPTMDTSRDTALGSCITQASAWVQAASGLILEQPATAITEILNGYDAGGEYSEVLYLDARRPYVLHSGGDLITVTEDGVSLTVSTVYSTTAQVFIENPQDFTKPCKLIRHYSAWSRVEPRNIAVTYKHGFLLAGMPAEVIALASEITWLIWSGQNWVGKQSVAVQGQSVSLEKNLTPVSQRTLARLRSLANV